MAGPGPGWLARLSLNHGAKPALLDLPDRSAPSGFFSMSPVLVTLPSNPHQVAKEALSFANIGGGPLKLTDEQRAQVEATLLHFAGIGASVALNHCRAEQIDFTHTV